MPAANVSSVGARLVVMRDNWAEMADGVIGGLVVVEESPSDGCVGGLRDLRIAC